MKRVVSVSIGSSERDHKVIAEFLGEKFEIERIGTDGDINKAVEMISRLDGKVDAFGLGGIDLYLKAGKKRYVISDALSLQKAAAITPVVDGSGLKDTLERRVVEYVDRERSNEIFDDLLDYIDGLNETGEIGYSVFVFCF